MTLDPLGPVLMVKRAGSVESLNWYNYCENNPVMYHDPTGEFVSTVTGFFIGGIGGGVKSIIDQKLENPGKKLNWKKVGITALIGGLKGGIVGLVADGTGLIVESAGSLTPLVLASGAVVGAAVGYGSAYLGNLAEQKFVE